MKKTLQQLYPGQMFVLRRTGETFQFLRRRWKEKSNYGNSGTEYVVWNVDRSEETILNPQVQVEEKKV